MLRSLFVASTPGRSSVFPDDTTPVTLIPRLLNAYAVADVPLASEESYWLDILSVSTHGLFDFEQLDA